ncbi:MAG TPA: antitoxin AF2212-like protein [Thermoanaerobaculia bacterium]|nr:antitoxin AF2212-like protein [Thermoanaerobaculia bacterium]
MTKTLEAMFDGEVLRPDEPLEMDPNTRVRITLEIKDRKRLSPEEILTLATSVYDGLTEEEITEVEQIALQRNTFFDNWLM